MHIKVIFKHAICWLLWFSVTTISSIINISEVPLWSYFFNISSLIVLFYLMYVLSVSYYNKLSLVEGLNKSKVAKWSYFLFRWEIGMMAGVIAMYICGAWAMDNYFYTIGHLPERYTDFLAYADGRFARAAFYVAGGIAYGLAKMAIQRKDQIIASQKALNIITMQENALMKNTYSKRVKEMRNMVKSALANKEED
jgi:hypothetical protein